jgi:hypothetical protein
MNDLYSIPAHSCECGSERFEIDGPQLGCVECQRDGDHVCEEHHWVSLVFDKDGKFVGTDHTQNLDVSQEDADYVWSLWNKGEAMLHCPECGMEWERSEIVKENED